VAFVLCKKHETLGKTVQDFSLVYW